MASPFRFFRKYQSWFYVVLGVLLMFAFVVLPPLADYLQSRGGGRQKDPTVVRWKYGKITRSELQRRMQAEYVIQDFLQQLMLSAQQRGGRPKASPISPARDEREIVRRLVLAKKAESLGVVISDAAILDYFDLVSDKSYRSRDEYMAVLRSVTGDRLSTLAVLNQIRVDLLSQRMMELAIGGTLNLSPGLLWEYHQKLNRRVTCDVFPVRAADYLSEVPQTVPDAELAKLYEEGKDVYPDPLSPKPGFKIRRKAAFGYFAAVFDEFLEKEMEKVRPTITEEDIKAYYEQNKQQFRETELPEETPSADEGTKPEGETGSETKAEKKDEPAGDDKDDQGEIGKDEEAGAGEKPPVEKGQSRTDRSPSTTYWVSVPAQDQPQKEPAKQSPPAEKQPTKQPANPPKPASEKPASAKPAEKKKADTDAPPAAAAEKQPPESQTTAGKPDGQDEAAKPTGEQPMAEEGAKTSEPPPIKYRPLDDKLKEEIRDRIAREKARPAALLAMQKALAAAQRSVERYANKLALANDKSVKREPPKRPDFAALAEKLGLKYVETPPLDLLQIAQIENVPAEEEPPYYDLLRATEYSLQAQTGFSPSVSFRQVAAQILSIEDPDAVALYQPRTISTPYALNAAFGIPPQEVFVFWVSAIKRERIPKLDEVRQQVVDYWRGRRAYEKAESVTKSIVEQAKSANQPLKEVLSDAQKEQLISTEPFSWMTMGALGAQGAPTLSPVRGKNGKGEEVVLKDLGDPFMEVVFGLHPTEKAVASDLPQNTSFALELTKEVLNEDELRELFLASGNSTMLYQLAQEDRIQMLQDWYEELDKEFEVQWVEDEA